MMHLSYILGALLCCSPSVLGAPYANTSQYSPQIQQIIAAATADGIDLVALPFASAAFAGIESIQQRVKINNTVPVERIDVHGVWAKRYFRHGRWYLAKQQF